MTSFDIEDPDFSDSDDSLESVDMSKIGGDDEGSDAELQEETPEVVDEVKEDEVKPADGDNTPETLDKVEDPEFSKPADVDLDDSAAPPSKTMDEIYKSATQEELVTNLSKHSDLVPKQVVLVFMGVYASYIKFEPSKDGFGFDLSKYLKDKNAIYQTVTCNTTVHHINVPSLSSDLKVKNDEYGSIFAFAAIEKEPAEIVKKLKANSSISFEGESNTSTVGPNTPFPEVELQEAVDGKGYIVNLIGDKLENAFNFLKCSCLLMDDSTPKRIQFSLILKTLAGCGVNKVTIINLATKKPENATNAIIVSAEAKTEKADETETVDEAAEGEEITPATDEPIVEEYSGIGNDNQEEVVMNDNEEDNQEDVKQGVEEEEGFGAAEGPSTRDEEPDDENNAEEASMTMTGGRKPPKLKLGGFIAPCAAVRKGGRKTKHLKFKAELVHKEQKKTRKKKMP